MEFRVLAIGDVTSEEGTAHLRRHLQTLGYAHIKGFRHYAYAIHSIPP